MPAHQYGRPFKYFERKKEETTFFLRILSLLLEFLVHVIRIHSDFFSIFYFLLLAFWDAYYLVLLQETIQALCIICTIEKIVMEQA